MHTLSTDSVVYDYMYHSHDYWHAHRAVIQIRYHHILYVAVILYILTIISHFLHVYALWAHWFVWFFISRVNSHTCVYNYFIGIIAIIMFCSTLKLHFWIYATLNYTSKRLKTSCKHALPLHVTLWLRWQHKLQMFMMGHFPIFLIHFTDCIKYKRRILFAQWTCRCVHR